MKTLTLALLALAVPFVLGLAAGRKAAPEIRAKKAAGKIRIDGRLDEPAWKEAAAVKLRSSDGKQDAARATKVRVLHDEKFLYLAFECEDPDIWTAHRGRDSWMWTEDVVEAFIDVDPSDPAYVELEVNPRGDLFDGMFFQHRGEVLMAWNPEIQVAVSVDGTVDQRDDTDRSWTVEMAIPAADLAPSESLGNPGAVMKPGTSWGINLYRVERGRPEKPELQAWAPVEGDFHAADRFGRIVFD